MKLQLHQVLAICMFAFFIVFVGVLLSKNHSRFVTQVKDFIGRDVDGIIVKMDNLHRGNYELRIYDSKADTTFEYDLRLGSFIEENGIQVNDSISKEPDSKMITFYKRLPAATYEKCCTIGVGY